MKIWTSYYSGEKRGMPISISVNPPRWFYGKVYKKLAPHKWMIAAHVTIPDYDVEFAKILAALDPNQVIEDLKALSGGENEVTLLCYEKPGEHCHRHLVADWLNANGINCEEVPPKIPKSVLLSNQLSLF